MEFCCAIYKSLALIDFGSIFVSKVRPKCENLGSSGLAVKQAQLQYFLQTVKPLSYPRKVLIASTKKKKNWAFIHFCIFKKPSQGYVSKGTNANKYRTVNTGNLTNLSENWYVSILPPYPLISVRILIQRCSSPASCTFHGNNTYTYPTA